MVQIGDEGQGKLQWLGFGLLLVAQVMHCQRRRQLMLVVVAAKDAC